MLSEGEGTFSWEDQLKLKEPGQMMRKETGNGIHVILICLDLYISCAI